VRQRFGVQDIDEFKTLKNMIITSKWASNTKFYNIYIYIYIYIYTYIYISEK